MVVSKHWGRGLSCMCIQSLTDKVRTAQWSTTKDKVVLAQDDEDRNFELTEYCIRNFARHIDPIPQVHNFAKFSFGAG